MALGAHWGFGGDLGVSGHPWVGVFWCRVAPPLVQGAPMPSWVRPGWGLSTTSPLPPSSPPKRVRLWHIKYLIGRKGTHWAHQE